MSDTLNVSVRVLRPESTALELSQPGVYEVVSVGPGARTWRRTTVEGRYAHGRMLTGAVMDTMTIPLIVRVYGSSWSQVASRAKTMIDAVSRRSYNLQVTIDSVESIWACEPADVSIVGGDGIQKFHAMAHMQEYQLLIPRHPIPLTGGF